VPYLEVVSELVHTERLELWPLPFFGPPNDRTVEIGYSIVPEHRRRGYATEAARALIAWARGQAGVDTVLARCNDDNQPSIRTLERLGFARAGEAESQIHWRRGTEGG
jgi:ribosomal-protein-alanine N-acetyltransferase